MIRFDLDESVIRQDALSLRYADECYVVTVTYLDNKISDPVNGITPDQTIMVRFGLKYLGDFSYKTDLLAFNQNENQ